jgi:hypothetical protein
MTHDLTRKAAAVRFADLEARRNPTQPYAGIAELDEFSEFS